MASLEENYQHYQPMGESLAHSLVQLDGLLKKLMSEVDDDSKGIVTFIPDLQQISNTIQQMSRILHKNNSFTD